MAEIHAINKDGREAKFSQRVWDMMPKHKNGWVEYNGQLGELPIPHQIVEFQQSLRKEDAVVEESVVEPTVVEQPKPIVKETPKPKRTAKPKKQTKK